LYARIKKLTVIAIRGFNEMLGTVGHADVPFSLLSQPLTRRIITRGTHPAFNWSTCNVE
jgi:hypothetical protein